MSYIAYSRKIDESGFLELVNNYTGSAADYNKEIGVVSDWQHCG